MPRKPRTPRARDSFPAAGTPASPTIAPRGELVAVTALALAYAAVFVTLCAIKYRWFLYTDFDFPIFLQAVDGILHGTLFSTIRGLAWPGDHSSLILFLVAPLYALVPHPLTLLVIQSLALAAGAFPVWRLARREWAPGLPAIACAALYLLQPALGYLNLFEFHPEALAVPLLLAALEGAWAGAVARTALFMGLAVLAREDVAFTALGLAAAVLLARRPRARPAALVLCALAAASLFVTFVILKPRFAAGEADYARMYEAWGHGPAQVALGILRQPLRALAALVSTPGDAADGALKRLYWVQLLLPLAGLALLRPVVLLPLLPIVAEHMLSSRTAQHSIVFQYAALVIPFAVGAAVLGAARLVAGRPRWGGAIAGAALAAAAASQVLFGPVASAGVLRGIGRPEAIVPDAEDRANAAVRARMLARIPRRGGVVAGFDLLSHLAGRARVYSIHDVIAGHYTFSTKAYPVPAGVAAMVANLGDGSLFHQVGPGTADSLRALFTRNRLQPVDAADDFVLYLAAPRDTIELVTTAVVPRAPARHPVVYDGQLALLGAGLAADTVRAGDELPFAISWARTASVDRMFLTEFLVVDGEGRRALQRWRYLGYLSLPPDRWGARDVVTETYRMVVPRELPPGRYHVGVRPWHRMGGSTAICRTDDPLAVRSEMFTEVGAFEALPPARAGSGPGRGGEARGGTR